MSKNLDQFLKEREKKFERLKPEQHMEIARRIAWFWPVSKILEFVKKEYKVSLIKQSISQLKNSDKWKPLIEQFREEYIKECGEIPLFHKRKRLEELQEMYDRFKASGDDKEARATLKEFREEAEGRRGDVSISFTQITNNEFTQMSDEDLQRERMKTIEQLERIKKIKLLANQGGSRDLGIKGTQETIEIEETEES